MNGKRLPELFEDMRQALLKRSKDTNIQETVVDAYSSMTRELKNIGGDTLSKTAQQFNEAVPYIQRAGYDITEVEVALGLSPKVAPHLRLREIIDKSEQEALLAETKGKTLVHTVLTSLFKASDARSKLKFRSFHFEEIELDISILPSVILKFRPNSQQNLLLEEAESAESIESEKP
jgi:hypothetical protein